MSQHGPHHIETNPDPAAFAHWPEGLYEEMLASHDNGNVGSLLVSETDRVRVWHLHIPVGSRCGFHRHVNPYFWTALNAGTARGYFSSGEVRDTVHYVGETKHFNYGEGDYMLHAVENVGDTPLAFTTVEFLDGENTPLDVPADMRLVVPA
ncbi:cupin domain-containing protein [Planktotalea sp.]|uniref:cupin domain-containing protein n=1 Tax=Planktotalea sp. TaxID=2029877 RepID=UPI003298C95C